MFNESEKKPQQIESQLKETSNTYHPCLTLDPDFFATSTTAGVICFRSAVVRWGVVWGEGANLLDREK